MKDYFNIERIMAYCSYVFYFLCINIFCILLNIPLVLFIIFLGLKNIIVYLPLFLICCIPLFVSFCASFYCMAKLIKNKDLNLFKDFIKGVKTSFLQSTFIGIIYLIIIFMICTNIIYSINNNLSISLIFFFIILLIFILLSLVNVMLLTSKFSIKSYQLVKYSFIITFTKPTLTLSNGFLFVFFTYLFTLYPVQVGAFLFSLISFCVYFVNKNFLNHLANTNII